MSDIDFFCNECKSQFDVMDIECPNCNDREKEKEDYTTNTLENVKKEFNKSLLQQIDDPDIHFADTSDDMISGIYMGSIVQFEEKTKEDVFIEGFKFGLKESMDWLRVVMFDFGASDE